ncbi:MAG: AAA family ATPase [bacterium]
MKRPDPLEARLVVGQLGAIAHAELTIRPLTLFFGPNGTNKTWTAYALYGLLHKLRGAADGTATLDGRELSRLLALDDLSPGHATLTCAGAGGWPHDVIAFPAERKALLALHRQLAALSVFGSLGPSADDPTEVTDLGRRIASERLAAAARSLQSCLPRPALDFIAFIDGMPGRPKPGGDAFTALAARLDEHLIGGHLDFVPRLLEGDEQRLRFASADARLPIQSTHSLLRSLGGLDLYLRHVAQPGDVILIDEPEMNAHPSTQLAIAEFLAMLVNAGVRVIATTHSPYIVDHLHNLIEASRLAPEAQATFAERFKLQSADAFIAADEVATYHFGLDGTVTDVFDRSDRLIDWSTFGAEADEIGNLYTELLAAQRDG